MSGCSGHIHELLLKGPLSIQFLLPVTVPKMRKERIHLLKTEYVCIKQNVYIQCYIHFMWAPSPRCGG